MHQLMPGLAYASVWRHSRGIFSASAGEVPKDNRSLAGRSGSEVRQPPRSVLAVVIVVL